MSIISKEFKARCADPERVKEIIAAQPGVVYKGNDRQIDIYFNVPAGRLKLRKGTIENNLIAYQRADYAGAKESKIELLPVAQDSPLERMLTVTLGVKVVVDKRRDIYFIENVKFHLDVVQSLGTFVEVEALNTHSKRSDELQAQCDHYQKLLGVRQEDMIGCSYSDLLLATAA